ncbi:CxxH/CxxC protein [Alkalihalobacillus sp. AL-G]|uniref:CxxH/CxxC protein n=1 Tax=Alkalihalobacillus sp. AL-G TaxID=2926399 RepID=UPI00272C8A19|nr:CxxH/CxxC protein [Alkalihalobacillus sp. AL-G]WLD93362.1 CxxH/CxxC protein [Alkalihalobacillus sp. AL-G]
MIPCCKEHIDLALDVIVDEHETAPVMKKLTENEQISTTCEYCNKPAIYMVSN